MPSPEQLVEHLGSLYSRYGYEIIFVGAALEALVIINFFIPGALVVAFGAIFARSGQIDLSLVLLAGSTGAMVGFILDYLLGYFGFGVILEKFSKNGLLNRAKYQVEKSGVRSFGLGFFHPNVGSLVSLAAGAIKMRFISFLILAYLSTLAWASLWALLIFSLGEIFLVILTKYFFILVILVVSVWILVNFRNNHVHS